MPKLQQIVQREIVDSQTGEVVKIDSSRTFTTKVTEDSFYMTFIDYISPLFGLKPEGAKNLLIWMCQHAEFNTGKVSLTTADRKEIHTTLGLATNSISNYLKTLKTLKLISGENGSYLINPQIFWKGDLTARKDLLKNTELRITFDLS